MVLSHHLHRICENITDVYKGPESAKALAILDELGTRGTTADMWMPSIRKNKNFKDLVALRYATNSLLNNYFADRTNN